MDRDIDGAVWKALLDGFTPEEQDQLRQVVTASLREQRDAIVAAQKLPGADRTRRRGRPRRHGIT